MLKLRRLRVDKFRNLAKGAELCFSDGINVVLGQNGTGKTTLLDLISMVVRSDFSTLAKEELALEYELAAGEGEGIVVRVKNERAELSGPRLPYEPELFRPSADVLGTADGRLLVHYDAERGLVVGTAAPIKPTNTLSCLNPRFLWLFITGVPGIHLRFEPHLLNAGAAHRFDESLDMLRRITSPGELLGELAGGPDWFPAPWALPLVPHGLVSRMSSAYRPGKPDYAFTDGDLEVLATLDGMMGFSSAELRLDVSEIRAGNGHARRLLIEKLLFRFFWPDGTFLPHDRLSYGQKRLLTFFYYLACNPEIVIADELVNGLHHRWITASVEALGERQAFLTSQNPLLLDYIPIPSAERARRSFVLCRGEPREGRPPAWIWENMTEADADELHRAYDVGVEHVSEILQSRGLW